MRVYERYVLAGLLVAIAVMPAMGQVGIFDQEADWGPRGSVKVDGSATFSGGTYSLEGNGDDIWNNDDEGFFIFTEKSGSWTLEGEFTWIDPGTNDWAKIGPMVREDGMDAESRHYWIMARGAADIVQSQWRMDTGGGSGWPGATAIDPEGNNVTMDDDSSIWMRVNYISEAGVVSSEISFDGTEWFLADSQNMSFEEPYAIGLAITNHEDNDFLAQGEVANVDLREFDQPVAIRSFSSDQAFASETLNVTINLLNPVAGTVSETIPENWTASEISNGGTESGGVISWDIDETATELTYTVTPGNDAIASTFSGTFMEGDIFGPSSVALVRGSVGDFENHADVGNIEAPGSSEFDGSRYIIRGGGADIWGSADAFHYAFSEFEGPFRIAGNALAFPGESSNDWVKTGIMVRNNLTPGSSNGFVQIDGGTDANAGFIRWQHRLTQDAASQSGTFFEDQFGDMYIERLGRVVRHYSVSASTGEPEFLGESIITDLEDPVLGGLAVTSHEVGSLSEMEFEPGLADLGFDIIELLPFSADRIVTFDGEGSPTPGDTMDVSVQIFSRESDDIEVTEVPPAGFPVSGIATTAGEASTNADGELVWTISGHQGNAELTYSVTVPENEFFWEWTGTANGEVILGNFKPFISANDGGLSFTSAETSTPPTIDGDLAEGEWANATMIDVDATDQDPPGVVSADSGPIDPPGIQPVDDFNATIMVMNDNDFIYVAIDVNDDVLDFSQPNIFQNDSAEIRIDGNFSRLTTKENNALGFSANITGNGVSSENVPEGGTLAASEKGDGSGYIVEFAAPITEEFETTVGFEVAINDSDHPDNTSRDSQVRINSLADSSWQDESQWARLTLTGLPVTNVNDWSLY